MYFGKIWSQRPFHYTSGPAPPALVQSGYLFTSAIELNLARHFCVSPYKLATIIRFMIVVSYRLSNSCHGLGRDEWPMHHYIMYSFDTIGFLL